MNLLYVAYQPFVLSAKHGPLQNILTMQKPQRVPTILIGSIYLGNSLGSQAFPVARNCAH